VKNFLDARYQSEVGVIPARLKIQEGFVTQAHKDLEVAAQQLVVLQAQKDPKKRVDVFIPTLPPTVRDVNEPPPDPQLQAQLDNVRGQINALQGAKLQRLAELNQQLVEQQQQKGPQHPDIIALKAQINAMQQDPPQLAQLKAQEGSLQQQIADKRAAQRAATPSPAPQPRITAASRDAGVTTAEPLPASAPKNVQDAQVQFDSASGKYQELVKNLQAIQLELQTADAAYKNRYKVTHPAEVPAGPKRPVGLIAVLIGVLATIAAVLMVAALADRFSGIFFEPRDVRDRLGLPVFATFS
jgi:acyl carrier protein phosphodiesterase